MLFLIYNMNQKLSRFPNKKKLKLQQRKLSKPRTFYQIFCKQNKTVSNSSDG